MSGLGTVVSPARRLITLTNASITFFYGTASRHLLSCRCKPSRVDSVRKLTCSPYKGNEPGGQLEHSIDATRSTYKLRGMEEYAI